MPPRRSARVADAVVQRTCAFPELPLEAVLAIFSLLPADQRLRAAEVSRGWRATVARPELWQRLDLSLASGVARDTSAPRADMHPLWGAEPEHPVSPALLRAVVARARGTLTSIDVSEDAFADLAELVDALGASAALVEMRVNTLPLNAVTALLAGLPQLLELYAGVRCEAAEAAELLAGGLPVLRLRELVLRPLCSDTLPPALVRALADARLQPQLRRLELSHVEFGAPPGAMDAVADAVVARRTLTALCFHFSRLTALAGMPALSRALRDGALTKLEIFCGLARFLSVDSVLALRAALRSSSTLTTLRISAPRSIGGARPGLALAALVEILVGHRSLSKLDLSGSCMDHAAVGTALAALLAADAPALTELDVSYCRLGGEAGLGPLCDVLPCNSHLRTLDFRGNDMRECPTGFMRARLLPAVRANTGLRKLWVRTGWGDVVGDDDAAAVQEAERIVAAR